MQHCCLSIATHKRFRMAHDHVASSSVAPHWAVVGLVDVLSCTNTRAHLLAQAGQTEKGISTVNYCVRYKPVLAK